MAIRINFRKIVIVIALCVVNGINGITRSSSLFFVASIDRFNVDREKASLPYSLRLVIEPLSGPFIGYLACIIGLRPVVVLGGFIASIAFAACFFAEDILTLCIVFGGFFGIGVSMAKELLPAVIDGNFKKDIAFINGLALIGSSISGLLLPLLFDVTFDMYGLSGTFLVIGGVLLHSVPAGMLLWSPKSTEIKTEKQNSKKMSELSKVGANDTDEIPIHSTPSSPIPNKKSTDDDTKLQRENKDNCIKDNEHHTNITSEASETLGEKEKNSKKNQEVVLRICNLPITNENTIQIERDYKSIIPTKSASKCRKNNKKNSLLEIISLCWDPLFILVTASQSLYKTTYLIYILIFMDFARDIGIQRYQAIYLVMCLSASDIVGRVGLAWITDRGYMGLENFSALSFTVSAACLFVISFWNEFAVMFTATFVFGLAAAALSMATPGIVSKYFEGNKKTTAMASRYFLCGPINLAISPLIGFFRMGLGSYIGLIYLLIAISLLCAVSQLFLPAIARRGSNNKEKLKTTNMDSRIERLI